MAPAAVGQTDALPAGTIDVHPAPRRRMARPPPAAPPTTGLRFMALGLMPTVPHLTGNTRSTPSKTQNPRGPTAGTG